VDERRNLLTGTALGSLSDSWAYNGFVEPASYSATYNSTGIYSAQYTYDKLGRITRKTEAIGGVTDTYDYANDLAGLFATVQNNSVTLATYTYDSNGNRLSQTGPGGTVNGSFDNQDRLTGYGAITYTYTANVSSRSTISAPPPCDCRRQCRQLSCSPCHPAKWSFPDALVRVV
jgi:YD repeat-containing protein